MCFASVQTMSQEVAFSMNNFHRLRSPVTMMKLWHYFLFCCLIAQSACATIVNLSAPILGWSTWNEFRGNINESLIREVADAMESSGLLDAGYTYINLDDAWASYERNASGHMTADPSKFPNGMHALSAYVHAKGFKFGLYTARNNRTCGGTMPGSLGYEQLDADTFAAFGADFVKNDDCRVVYANAVKDYGAMQEAIANAPRPMLHNVKAPDLPAAAAPGVCQLRRVGKDIKNSFENLVRVLDTGMSDAFAAKVGPRENFFNDFDMMEVGSDDGNVVGSPKLTDVEQRAHFSLWAALKSPMVLGNDPRNMSASTLTILLNKEVLAVNQDVLAVPVRLVSRALHPGASTADRKTVLRPCNSHDVSQMWITVSTANGSAVELRNVAMATGTGDDTTVSQHRDRAASTCMGVWNCETKWPWWISTAPCASTQAANSSAGNPRGRDGSIPPKPRCSIADTQRWRWVSLGTNHSQPSTSGVMGLQWVPQHFSSARACWGSPGSGCCLSAEGANVEIDTCGWPENISQQAWQWQDVDTDRAPPAVDRSRQPPRLQSSVHRLGAIPTTATSPRQLVSQWNGHCLSLAGDLEVYAGPLQPPTSAHTESATATSVKTVSSSVTAATVVLFNRSPVEANMTVVFSDLARTIGLTPSGRCGSGNGGVPMAVRDLWAHADLGVHQGEFTASVAPHGVVHVNLLPPPAHHAC
eukprot:m.209367 g.209367  ORF g.209367 m.209367 type:complete len:700 (+) comp18979_c0_seq1:97-2196(+)